VGTPRSILLPELGENTSTGSVEKQYMIYLM